MSVFANGRTSAAPVPRAGVARTRDQAAKAEPAQDGADAALGQHDAEPGLDRPREVSPAPAHRAMLGQVGPAPDPCGDDSLLLGGEPWLGAEITVAISQPGQALHVVAVHPVAQCLPIHSCRLRGLGARYALHHERQSEHMPRSGNAARALSGRRNPAASRSVRVILIGAAV